MPKSTAPAKPAAKAGEVETLAVLDEKTTALPVASEPTAPVKNEPVPVATQAAAKSTAKKPVATKKTVPAKSTAKAKVIEPTKVLPKRKAEKATPVVAPSAALAKPEKPAKQKKPKLVRDSFTMPDDEYEQIASIKKRLLAQGIAAKKSELLRAGLALLHRQSAEALIAEMNQLKPIKMGRPAK